MKESAKESKVQQRLEPAWIGSIESANERRALLNSLSAERLNKFVSLVKPSTLAPEKQLTKRSVNAIIRLLEAIVFACSSDNVNTNVRQEILAGILKIDKSTVGRQIAIARRAGLIVCTARFHPDFRFQQSNTISINWLAIKSIASIHVEPKKKKKPRSAKKVDLSNETTAPALCVPGPRMTPTPPPHNAHPAPALCAPGPRITRTLVSTYSNVDQQLSTFEEEEIDFSDFEKVKTALIGSGVELATDAISKSQNKRDAPPASILLAIIAEFDKRTGISPGFLKRKIENATAYSVPANGWPANSSVRKHRKAPDDATRRDLIVRKLKSLRQPIFEIDGNEIELYEWIETNVDAALAAGESIDSVNAKSIELYQFLKSESDQ